MALAPSAYQQIKKLEVSLNVRASLGLKNKEKLEKSYDFAVFQKFYLNNSRFYE